MVSSLIPENFANREVVPKHRSTSNNVSETNNFIDFLKAQNSINVFFGKENIDKKIITLMENSHLIENFLLVKEKLGLPIKEFEAFIEKNKTDNSFLHVLPLFNGFSIEQEKILFAHLPEDFLIAYFKNIKIHPQNIEQFSSVISPETTYGFSRSYHLNENIFRNNFNLLSETIAREILIKNNISMFSQKYFPLLSSANLKSIDFSIVDIHKLPVMAIERLAKNNTLPNDIKNQIFKDKKIAF